jgi:hypothetical protein
MQSYNPEPVIISHGNPSYVTIFCHLKTAVWPTTETCCTWKVGLMGLLQTVDSLIYWMNHSYGALENIFVSTGIYCTKITKNYMFRILPVIHSVLLILKYGWCRLFEIRIMPALTRRPSVENTLSCHVLVWRNHEVKGLFLDIVNDVFSTSVCGVEWEKCCGWCIEGYVKNWSWLIILSRMRRSVTNNNRLWIGWLDLLAFLYNYSQLQQLTINNWNSLHSLLDCECLLFCVTDLVLIYESVTCSASVAHSWTLNSLTNAERRLTLSRMNWTNSFIIRGEPNISPHVLQFRLVVRETCVSEPLASDGLFRFSGVMSQYDHSQNFLGEWKL